MGDFFQSLMARYKYGYSAARVIVTAGALIRLFGIVISCVVALFFIFLLFRTGLSSGMSFLVYGIICSPIACGVAYVIGTLVSGLGQGLSALVDSAVNSSPHLTNEEKAEIMGLVANKIADRSSALYKYQTIGLSDD